MNGNTGKSFRPRRRYNLSSLLYTEDLGARVVAQTGIPTDRFHLGKLIFQSLKDRPDLLLQIDGAVDKSETAGSVLARSVQCAIAMKNLGLKKGDVMAILAPNHLDLIITVYAAMYQGIILAGTDMTLGVGELESTFKTTKPSIVFCQSDRASDIENALKRSNTNGRVVTFDKDNNFQSFDEFLQEYSEDKVKVEDFKPADFDPEETVLFLCATSGTTGLPKWAIITHKNMVLGCTQFFARNLDYPTPTRLFLLVSPSQWLSASLLYYSAALFKFTRLQTSAPVTRDHVYDLINKYKPTSVLSSPTLMVTLLEKGQRERCDFTCFETFMLGGSFVHESVVEKTKIVAPESEAEIAYGMSELAGVGMIYETEYPKGCVGKLCPHLQYRFVDPVTLEDITEPNVAGEMWYKGPTISKGYYNNPEATHEAFTDGWFRSGDLFRRDERHHYYYVDRFKLLLKYKNHQISPIEVEGVIIQHPGVLDAAVVGVPDLECGDLTTAFVVPRIGQTVTAQEIKDIVKDNLADSKQLRGGVIFLEKLPVTATSKVDRTKLKKMAAEMERE